MSFLKKLFSHNYFTQQLILSLCLGLTAIPQLVQAENPVNKIRFDLSAISPEGLMGDQNSLRSLSYEFCIPAQLTTLKEVKVIDKTLQYSRSRGRIGCRSNQYLCIGDTHQSQWKTILLKLAGLDYVKKIEQFWGE